MTSIHGDIPIRGLPQRSVYFVIIVTLTSCFWLRRVLVNVGISVVVIILIFRIICAIQFGDVIE
jgi:hypothetical protein